ncbi:MAG: DNA translocase FtsK [Nitrospinaceae bacterium]|nr:DNA translocase FtsK [Nitrospinaceae bacterium]NIR54418.1 DNA translocase FtsK [Nitrospinaceae bacterium]NIS84832.1 DNA translocase FtsK [Nitrospinaceae bacterium]NIT81637.1 DNA translocase FtsK [Nitrospinaceae bacterium]NIU43920.1 DNA translocase FtsK [Nitrospinaceae bacterium]
MSKENPHNLKRDFMGLGTIGLALFALVSLISYSPHDPSFHRFSTQGEQIHNYGGVVGSYMADGLVRFFGTGALALPLVAFLVGWAVVRGQEFRRWPMVLLFGSIFLMALCSLLALQLKHDPYFGGDVATGGWLGTRASEMLSAWLGKVGTHLVMFLTLFVSSLAMSGVPANQLFQTTGQVFMTLIRWLAKGLRAGGALLIGVGAEIAEWTRDTLTIWRAARKDKLKHRRLSEPVIVSRELLSPGHKMFDGVPEPKKPEKEKTPREDFAVQENFPFVRDLGNYRVPPVSLLSDPAELRNIEKIREELMFNSTILERKLSDFGVEGKVVQVLPGPVITLYEFEPAPGIKVSRILSLTDDLALAMRAPSVRILAPVPGKSVVGIELPNPKRETVAFKEIVCSESFQELNSRLALAVGKDHIGRPVTEDLAQVPHLLMAGSTGSGKSVGINTMICSLLLNATPEEVKMIMIDPKMLELSMYDGIPHLIAPVVTNPKKAAAALQWAVAEMERRYKLMAEKSVRNIAGYNHMVEKILNEPSRKKKTRAKKTKKPPVTESGEEALASAMADEFPEQLEVESPSKLPYIVIIIDELADLMMVASKGVEDSLTRLAQMARAAGIHLIVATQRPSVDVLTGIIKANFPARISYQVTSRVDSRTILDHSGAEKLLGKGDMLFLPPGTSKMQRIHGAMVSDEEINRILQFIKDQNREPEFEEDVFQQVAEAAVADEEGDEFDEKYDEAVALVARERQASISMIQRKLRVGYNRAARMVEIMEREGVVGPSDGIKPREVYVKPISLESFE